MKVKKYGRTTGYTVGYIVGRDADINVELNGSQVQFENQFIVESIPNSSAPLKPFSLPGDSGSLIVEYETNKAVGLLFAGNQTGRTFSNPISKGAGIEEKNGQEFIVIFLSKASQAILDKIPSEYEGNQVETQVTGPVHAFKPRSFIE